MGPWESLASQPTWGVPGLCLKGTIWTVHKNKTWSCSLYSMCTQVHTQSEDIRLHVLVCVHIYTPSSQTVEASWPALLCLEASLSLPWRSALKRNLIAFKNHIMCYNSREFAMTAHVLWILLHFFYFIIENNFSYTIFWTWFPLTNSSQVVPHLLTYPALKNCVYVGAHACSVHRGHPVPWKQATHVEQGLIQLTTPVHHHREVSVGAWSS